MEERKKTRTDWLALARAWEQSGQSQRDFCAAEGLKPATFSYWRGQYLREGSDGAGFVALSTEAGPSPVRLRLGSVEVELSADADFVADVLLNLAGRC